jgi:hypothetical protein
MFGNHPAVTAPTAASTFGACGSCYVVHLWCSLCRCPRVFPWRALGPPTTLVPPQHRRPQARPGVLHVT